MHTDHTTDTDRQTRMILNKNPSAMDRLIQDTPQREAWERKQHAVFDRMVVAELREERAQTCRIRR